MVLFHIQIVISAVCPLKFVILANILANIFMVASSLSKHMPEEFVTLHYCHL